LNSTFTRFEGILLHKAKSIEKRGRGVPMRSGLVVLCVLLSGSLLGQAPAAEVEQARNVLRDGFDSSDFTVRVQVIQAVGLVGQTEALRTRLEGLLQDGNVSVRVAAVNAIADLKFTASLPALRKCLEEDTTPEVTFAAAKALYGMHDPAGENWLVDVYNGTEKGKSDMLHSEMRKFVGNFHSFESAGTFLVASGAGYVPVPGVGAGFSAAMGLLNDPNLTPRAVSLIMLARDKSARVDGLLRSGLSDKDWTVRASAAQMIAYTARSDMREELVPLFTDKTEKVRFRAAGAYLHLALASKGAASAKQ
jgi:HEAT repeat protein